MSEVSGSEQKKEDWMNSKWRPMMGWMYMVVCTMDMVVFPILWSLLQTFTHTQITQWNPLTLQGAGLFHIAMGAVLGIAAFGRTQEKLNGANNGGLQTPATGSPSGATTPSAPSTGFSAPASGFGTPTTSPAPSTSFTSPASWGSTPIVDTTASGKKIVPDFGQPAL
jgi:Holin of 3TMs, for gene-transfer release